MSEQQTIYPEGIRTFAKSDKAPEFVLGTIVITLNDLVKFGKEHPELLTEYNGQKQLKLQCLKRKDGKGITLTVDTFKPQQQAQQQVNNNTNVDDLPF